MKKIKYLREIGVSIVFVSIFIGTVIARSYVADYYNEGKGYEWQAIASTTTGLPLMFARCDFHYTGYYGNNCDRSVMLYGDSSDRQIDCGGSGIGGRKDLYPDNLEILYYSFNENKFYGGKFKLDYDKILLVGAQMRKAVQIGHNGKTESIKFNVKVYPKGKVVFSMKSYLNTSIGEMVIANFQASEENHDWSVFEDKDQSSGVGNGKSNSVKVQHALLLNKYDWQLKVLLPTDCAIQDIAVNMYGNRGLRMDTLKNAKVPIYGNFVGLPEGLILSWHRQDTIQFSTRFKFNEEKIISAFDIASNAGKTPVIMQLIVKNDTAALRAVLHGNGKRIELKDDELSAINSEKTYH